MGNKGTVVIVEDDADIRESLAEILSDEGWVVHSAADGAQALELMATIETPSVVLLDLLMPALSGWEVLAKLRADGCTVPVIVLSAAADAARVLSAGADGFLPKPLGVAALLSAVERHARR